MSKRRITRKRKTTRVKKGFGSVNLSKGKRRRANRKSIHVKEKKEGITTRKKISPKMKRRKKSVSRSSTLKISPKLRRRMVKKKEKKKGKSSFRSDASYNKFLENLVLPERNYNKKTVHISDEEPRKMQPLLVPPEPYEEDDVFQMVNTEDVIDIDKSVRTKSTVFSENIVTDLKRKRKKKEDVVKSQEITIESLPKWNYGKNVKKRKSVRWIDQGGNDPDQSQVLASLSDSLMGDNNLESTLFDDTDPEFPLINKGGKSKGKMFIKPDRYRSDEGFENPLKKSEPVVMNNGDRNYQEEREAIIKRLPRKTMIDVGVQVNTILPTGACYDPIIDEEVSLKIKSRPGSRRDSERQSLQDSNYDPKNVFRRVSVSEEKRHPSFLIKSGSKLDQSIYDSVEDGFNIDGWVTQISPDKDKKKIDRISMIIRSTEDIMQKLKEVQLESEREKLIKKSVEVFSKKKKGDGKRNISVSEIFGSKEGMSRMGGKLDLWKERLGIKLPDETYETDSFIVIPKMFVEENMSMDEEDDDARLVEDEGEIDEEDEEGEDVDSTYRNEDFSRMVRSPEKKLEIWKNKLECYERTGNWRSFD